MNLFRSLFSISSLIYSAIGIALIVMCRVAVPRLLRWRGISMRRHTMFGTTLVFDSTDAYGEPVRLLNVDGKFQSVCYTSDELWCELTCAYHRHFSDMLFCAGWPDNALVLGGGGFSFPKYLIAHDDFVQLDVCEIDPAIITIAREHFRLDELRELAGSRMRLLIEDGWAYLLGTHNRYDLIVNDAFGGKKSLGPTATREGALCIKEHLSEQGLYFANVISPVKGNKAEPLMRTIELYLEIFGYVYLFPELPEHLSKPGNNAFIASTRPLAVDGAVHATTVMDTAATMDMKTVVDAPHSSDTPLCLAFSRENSRRSSAVSSSS